MPTIGTILPGNSDQTAAELRARAQHIREHAVIFWREPTAPRWLELADDLDVQAAALEARSGSESVWDQVSAGWTRKG